MPSRLRQYRHQPFRVLTELAGLLGDERGAVDESDQNRWVGLGVRLGEQWLLLPRGEVAEVLRMPTAARVPGAKSWLLGVANVRGALVSIIDLNAVFGSPPVKATARTRAIVFRGVHFSTAFLVDEVSGFHRFRVDDQRHELQADAPQAWHPFLLGAFVDEGNSWVVFSLARLSKSNLMLSAAR